ncbi:hypothetical protein [Brachybacterium phenoliresistens]|uniref:hypothetical protein n=1 Tax=Brachybacterium phenoliresistens TaxID=396014 RepID=UPI0031D9704D
MTTLGIALLAIAGLLLLASLVSVYSTTMTVHRSRVSSAALVLAGAAILVAAAGVAGLIF